MGAQLNIQSLIEASDLLGVVANNFLKMPEERLHTANASLQCSQARIVLLAVARQLAKGAEPYDAYLTAAIGNTPIDEAS